MNDSEKPVALITMAGDYVAPALARIRAASGHQLVPHTVRPEPVDELTASGGWSF